MLVKNWQFGLMCLIITAVLLKSSILNPELPLTTPTIQFPTNRTAVTEPEEGQLSGNLKMWQRLTISFAGPVANETDEIPNPFLDYRLQVVFTGPGGQVYEVPGFFDGDGKGNGSGNVWKVHFAPDEAGQWHYRASFRSGQEIAVTFDPRAGKAAGFDGASGTFLITEPDPDTPDFFQWGFLEYVGNPYLKFRNGPYWLKGGTDSPENFLAYAGFDGTTANHRYEQHLADWEEGDPDWGNGRGRAIIGAINYLASQHVNSIYFLPMNIGGDGKDTWPFVGPINARGHSSNDNLQYDISKLFQWEILFAHAQNRGILLHFVLNEGEEANKRELDNATLGIERKLYYRELIARFGHHPALIWNLLEEYNYELAIEPDVIKEWADYIKAVDPYDHPVTVHNYQGGLPATLYPQQVFADFLGDGRIDLLSIQYGPEHYEPVAAGYGDIVELLQQISDEAGRPLPIFIDEPDRASIVDDESHQEEFPMLSGHSFIRKTIIWPVYLSGGGVEFILEDLLDTEDFSRYGSLWQYTWFARKFMEDNLPFWEMEPADDLLTGEPVYHLEDGQVLTKPGEIYAVYLPKANPGGQMNLRQEKGCFRQRWYNPRVGQFDEQETIVVAGGIITLDYPPSGPDEDWALLLEASQLGCLPLVREWLQNANSFLESFRIVLPGMGIYALFDEVETSYKLHLNMLRTAEMYTEGDNE